MTQAQSSNTLATRSNSELAERETEIHDAELLDREPDLSTPEGREQYRLQLEKQVREAFAKAVLALKEIRDKELFKLTPEMTFEEYCLIKFGFKKRQAYHQLEAAEVLENLQQNARAVHFLPVNEYQIRPLTRFRKKPKLQVMAWKEAVDKAGDRAPSHELVKEVVREIQAEDVGESEDKSSFQYKVGSVVCVVKNSEHEELASKAGCWGIVQEIKEDVYTIRLWDGVVEGVSSHDLKKSSSTVKSSKKKYQKILDDLNQVDGDKLDEAAKMVVRFLAKKKEPVLSDFEKGLVRLLKSQYKKTGEIESESESEEEETNKESLTSVQPQSSEEIESEDKSEEAEELEQLPASGDVTTEEVATEQKDLLTGLSQAALAKRLKAGATTVGRWREKEEFYKWSQERDPDKIGWMFDKKTRTFSQVISS